MVFVQHTLTRQYLRSWTEWSSDLNEAWVFKDTTEALTLCQLCGLRDAQIVVAEREAVHQFAVVMNRHAVSMRTWKTIPVVLPQSDLGAN